MQRVSIFSIIAVLSITVSGCLSTVNAQSSAQASLQTATSAPATSSPTALPTIDPLMNSCDAVLNSQDLTGMFADVIQKNPGTHAELERGAHTVNPVSQLKFSTLKVAGQESSCTDYVFFSPGRTDTILTQVNFWLDQPNAGAVGAANQAWKTALSQSSQTFTNIGDGAFYQNGNLSLKVGNYYLTINLTDTKLDPNTSAGAKQLLKLEQQLAQAAAIHLK